MNEAVLSGWEKSAGIPLTERWPRREDGSYEPPVFLCMKRCNDMADRLLVNMLEAYSIPCLSIAPGDGSFGTVVLGMSGQGMAIYVPESLLADAQELMKEDSNE